MVKEMVAILFPATKNIDEVVGIIEKYRMKFGLDTGLRLAHLRLCIREYRELVKVCEKGGK